MMSGRLKWFALIKTAITLIKTACLKSFAIIYPLNYKSHAAQLAMSAVYGSVAAYLMSKLLWPVLV